VRRARPIVLCIAAAALAGACGPKHVPAPARPAPALVVLLPDADGKTGRARVVNEFGATDLTNPRQAASVTAERRPGPAMTMSEAELNRVFSGALAALPEPPKYFTLYFQFDTDQLTEQSRALLPQILRTVKERSMPEVTVVGHTDTTGTPRANIELGMKRAATVRNILIKAGLDASLVEVTSHGETDLLMRTPDGTPELHNRRVEISVR
jgi:outer membrane protein OmpA-like peptidoglycan-associated protein